METCGNCKKKRFKKCSDDCSRKLCSECMTTPQELKCCMNAKQRLPFNYLCDGHKKLYSGYCTECCKLVCKQCRISLDHIIITPRETAANIKSDISRMRQCIKDKFADLEQSKKFCDERETGLLILQRQFEYGENTQRHIPSLTESITTSEEQIKELQNSCQKKHILLTAAESNLESIQREEYSLRIIISWLNLKSTLQDYDEIASHQHKISQNVVFHPDLKNKAYHNRKLEVNTVQKEKLSPSNKQVEDLALQFSAVKLHEGAGPLVDFKTSQVPSSEVENDCDKEYLKDLINVLYKFACDVKVSEFQDSEKSILLKKVNPGMEHAKQQAGYILTFMLEKRKECLEREEKIETLNHRLANLPEENIRAQLEQNIMGKDEKLATFTQQIKSMEMKMAKQNEENSSIQREMENLKTDTFEKMKQVQHQNAISLKASDIRITELMLSITEEKGKVALLQNERINLHNHIIMKDKEIQRVMRENEDKYLRIDEEKEKVALLQNERINLHNHIIMKDKEIQRVMTEKEDKVLSPFKKQLIEQKEKEKQLILLLKENEDKVFALRKEKDDKIRALQKEKDDFQTRLSSVAGEKLTAGNPAITDLGDPNRPMKIGEMYGELYDNEWTDAMDVTVEAKGFYPDMGSAEVEEIVIRHLYRLLMCTYHQCVTFSAEQLNIIRKSIATTLHLELQSDDASTSFPMYKEIIQIRRQNTEKSVNFLLENQVLQEKMVLHDWEYEYKNEHLVLSLMKTPFFEKCIRLCWLMAIQNPYMHLEGDLQPGSTFDKNLYKEFVQSGDRVKYVVWPAMFLHINGPLLYKGVVQAYWQQ